MNTASSVHVRHGNLKRTVHYRCALVVVMALVMAIGIWADTAKGNAFPRGVVAVGFQRACWTAWGPSLEIDAASPGFARFLSLEAVFGIIPNWDAWDSEYYDAYALRTYFRPLIFDRSNLYIVGMFGSAAFYEGWVYGRCYILGAYAGGELDFRSLGIEIPITINVEGGYEYKVGYAYPYGYPTFGLGIRYWLFAK